MRNLVVAISVLLAGTQAANPTKQEVFESLVYPWPSQANWPKLKIGYNYSISGEIRGTQILKDGTYSYSKDKGMVEPLLEKTFSFYTVVKVDSKNQRAVQMLYTDKTMQAPISTNAIDFKNARIMMIERSEPSYHKKAVPDRCQVTQFQDTLMDSRRMLNWLWTPRDESPVNYMGLQCLSERQQNVLGFKGRDAEGIPWQTFFDSKTRMPIQGYSGNPSQEEFATQVEFYVDKYRLTSGFDGQDAQFYPPECVADYDFEAISESMMASADFGLFFP